LTIYQRLKNIRKQRNLRQEDVCEWFGVESKQAWGKKESGKDKGFSRTMEGLDLFFRKTETDPNYLFGNIDSFEEADLREKPVISEKQHLFAALERAQQENQELVSKLSPEKTKDKLSLMLRRDEIRRLLEALLKARADAADIGQLMGYLARMKEEEGGQRQAANE